MNKTLFYSVNLLNALTPCSYRVENYVEYKYLICESLDFRFNVSTKRTAKFGNVLILVCSHCQC